MKIGSLELVSKLPRRSGVPLTAGKIENSRRNFIPLNEEFICEKCGENIPPAPSTFRNHCPVCLTGKHVDDTVPGDRASQCQGLMPTIRYEGTDPDRLNLIQQCQQCQKTHRNRTAPDDNLDRILLITNN